MENFQNEISGQSILLGNFVRNFESIFIDNIEMPPHRCTFNVANELELIRTTYNFGLRIRDQFFFLSGKKSNYFDMVNA